MGFFNWIKSLFVKGEKIGTANVVTFNQNNLFLDNAKEFNATYVNTAFRLSIHAAKQTLQVINAKTNNTKHAYLDRKLNYKPNPLQTAFSMWQSFYYDHFFYGLGMIYVEWDYYSIPMRVKNFWPISSNDIVRTKVYDSKLYIEFNLNGTLIDDVIDNFIVLVRKPTSEDMLNVKDPSLKVVLNVLSTNSQGIIKAINNSNAIRFIVTSPAKLSDPMKTENQKKFNKRVEEAEAVLYADQAEQIHQVNNQSKYAEHEVSADFQKEIFRSFGVNEKFLDSSFNEDDWQSLYEGALDPLFIAMKQELTNKLFSDKEYEVGNRIEIVLSPLQTASWKTRISAATAYLKLPIIKPNVVCDLLYLPHLDEGDKEVQSLNFVNTNFVDKYQGGEKNSDKEDE